MKNLVVSIVAGIIVALIVALATYSLTIKKELNALNIKIEGNSKETERLNTQIGSLLSLTEKIHEKKSAFDKLVTEAQVRFNDIKGEPVNIGEFELPQINMWKEILELRPKALVKLQGYTSENNYFQPWEIYAWKAYEGQDAGMYIVPYKETHAHSNAVEWAITPGGKLRLRKTKFNDNRAVFIKKLIVYYGDIKVLVK